MKLFLEKKAVISNVVLSFFLLLSLSSFIDISDRTLINSKVALEVFFLAMFLIVFYQLKINRKVLSVSAVILAFLLLSLLQYFFYSGPGRFFDYLVIYKAFFYLLFLSFFVGKEIINQALYRKLFNLLVFFFLIKYSLMTMFGYGFKGRPELFTENNFELMTLALLYIGVYRLEKKVNKLDLLLLLLIFSLSGSRSGVLVYAIVLLFLDFGSDSKLRFFKYLLLVSSFIVVFYVFVSRLSSGGFESIDRFQFLLHFLNEISNWNFLNFVFGSGFMTPMSYETAHSLFYYKTLFSDHDEYLTFSVIFHSFILRTLFDHGFFGLVFVFYSIWVFLKITGFEKSLRYCIILILFVTGLSVSSLNSIFVILPLGLLFITCRRGT